MKKEVEKWPYSFPVSEDFLHVDQRGSVCGRLFAQDRLDGFGLMIIKKITDLELLNCYYKCKVHF